MAAKTLATYISELSAVTSLGAGDKIPVLESSTIKYVEGDDIQAADADLTTIAGLTPSDDDFLQRKSGAWANRTLAQVRTDLGVLQEVETTGTITGTGAVLVPCFPIPDANPYSVSGGGIIKCTDAGAGTVVVGECLWYVLANAQINGGAVENSDEGSETAGQTSMAETIFAIQDVNSGQLRISITPPSDTAAADSEFSYKIRLSGFSL